MFANPNAPNLPDYTLWVQNVMGINVAYLPPSSPFLGYALGRAEALVLRIPSGYGRCSPAGSLMGFEYTLAVYNCAGHIQLKITPDQIVDGIQWEYFLKKREDFRLLNPITGMVASTSDEGTSSSFAVPDALAQLTAMDLDFMKTPWGREYIAFQQDYGPTIWSLT